MRLIDYDAAIDRYYAEYEAHCGQGGTDDRDWLKKCFEEAPTIDPQNFAAHSKWTKTDYKPSIFTKCSLCGHRVEIQNKSQFCPGCGAKMTNA